jgi:DNA polymerase-3 subunit gamma/tau
MLSKNAFNALLKTLEEPPPHVVFIFATTEPHKIPDTVLSRTQQYEFKMVSLHAIRDYLEKLMKAEQAVVPTDVLALVARKAAGSVRDALSYMDQVLSYGPDRPLTEIAEVLGVVDRQALLDISAATLAGEQVAVLDVLERLGATNWDVKDLLADLLEHFRNLVAAKLAKQPGALIDAGDAELAALAKQVEPATSETLEHLFLLLAESEELILRSGQPRLVLEMTLVRLAGAAKTKTLDELLDRLIALKEGLAAGNPPSAPPVTRGEGRAAPVREAERAEVAAEASPAEAEPVEDLDPITNPRGALAAALRTKRRSLAALLLSAQVVRDGDRVIVQAPRGVNFTQFERDLAVVQEAVSEAFGPAAVAVLEQVEPKAEASPRERLEAQKAEEERRRAIQRESLTHPAVQWTKEMFPEAEVVVRPLKPAELKEE